MSLDARQLTKTVCNLRKTLKKETRRHPPDEVHKAHTDWGVNLAYQERHIFRGVLAGIGGGLVASWVMNEFIEGPGQKLQKSLQSEQEQKKQERQQQEQRERGVVKEDATMKTADAHIKVATGGA